MIGTRFYVSVTGLFVTAKHVIDEAIREGQQVAPLAIMHLHPYDGASFGNAYSLRPVGQCWCCDDADVAFGAAASAEHRESGAVLTSPCFRLSWRVPLVGETTGTYAFPNQANETISGLQTIIVAALDSIT
ncbi:MAG: hypothetical protein ABI408_09965 [Gemmatimonadaceae bacterium]